MINKDMLLNELNNKNIQHTLHIHDALYTVDDSIQKRGSIPGTHTKNLFLKNKKNNFFLITCEENDEINLKKISKSLNLGNVSFAKEEYLLKYLGVKPGSVSPFALLNDKNNIVNFFMEKKIYDSQLINFHPLLNDATITIEKTKFIEFMIEKKIKIHIFSSLEGLVIKTYE